MTKKRAYKRLPRWMSTHVRKCKAAFGLNFWQIDVTRVAKLRRDGMSCLGYHTSTYRTLTSSIEYEAKLKNNDFGHDVVTHEFLHVALLEPDRAMQRIMDFVPKKHQAHCARLYEEAKEHTVESLARSLTPVLRAVTNEGKDKGKDKAA